MIAQSRNRQRDYRKPVIQVLAKAAFIHALLQIAIGCDQQSHVGMPGFGRAEPRDQPISQHP